MVHLGLAMGHESHSGFDQVTLCRVPTEMAPCAFPIPVAHHSGSFDRLISYRMNSMLMPDCNHARLQKWWFKMLTSAHASRHLCASCNPNIHKPCGNDHHGRQVCPRECSPSLEHVQSWFWNEPTSSRMDPHPISGATVAFEPRLMVMLKLANTI